jgi:hypothetical protein
MFDADLIRRMIGEEAYKALHDRHHNLPMIETMTLLHIWAQSSRAKLRDLAQAGELVPMLKKQYRSALDEACEARMHYTHLTQTECLQTAGLPLTL